jgi:hypothetical protein
MGAPPLTTADWVAAAIEATSRDSARRRGRVYGGPARALRDDELRAALRTSTVFTVAGKIDVHKPGERVILGPSGEMIRVVEVPEGGNQIEHDEHLHAVIRPNSAAVTATARRD